MNDEPKQMPYAPGAESAILACLIENPERFLPRAAEAKIEAAMFFGQPHQSLWKLISERNREGKSLDPASLADAVESSKLKGLDLAKLTEIVNSEYAPHAWPDYVHDLRDRYARRLAIKAANSAYDAPAVESVASLRHAIETATKAISGATDIKPAKVAMREFIDGMEAAQQSERPGIPTGIDALDNLTGGMRKGELWVIGARTSRGKSVLMLQIANHLIMEGMRVAIFSLELGAAEIIGRIIANRARVDFGKIMNPNQMTKGEVASVTKHSEPMMSEKLFICDTANQTIDSIAGQCQILSEYEKIDLVVIDYLQQVVVQGMPRGANREQEIAAVSRGCKQLAKRLGCPVLTASQLNEAGHARESRAIEHDADAVFYVTHKIENKEETTRLLGWKHRNGKRNQSAIINLRGEYQRFDFLTEFGDD